MAAEHEVLRVLAARAGPARGDAGPARGDGLRVALAIEGGGMRGGAVYRARNSPLTLAATSSLVSTAGLPVPGPAYRSAMPAKTPLSVKG